MRRVEELARAIKNERPPRPAPGEPLQPPPGTGLRMEGAVRCTLRIEHDRLVFVDGDNEVEHEPAGQKAGDAQRLWELERARRRGPEDNGHITRAAAAEVGAVALRARSS